MLWSLLEQDGPAVGSRGSLSVHAVANRIAIVTWGEVRLSVKGGHALLLLATTIRLLVQYIVKYSVTTVALTNALGSP